jgi:hypothetical protein
MWNELFFQQLLLTFWYKCQFVGFEILSGDSEEYDLCAMYFGRSQPVFQRNMLSPSSGSKSKPNKKPALSRLTLLLPGYCWFCAWLTSSLKMEARCSSKTLVDLCQTTLHYNPEDCILQMSIWLKIPNCHLTNTWEFAGEVGYIIFVSTWNDNVFQCVDLLNKK